MPLPNGLTPELLAFLDRSPCAREICRVYGMVGACTRAEYHAILHVGFSTDIIDEALAELERLGLLRRRPPRLPIRFCECRCPQCGPLKFKC